MRYAAIILILLALTNASAFVKPVVDKIKPEELVAKHLEAIGIAEARSSNRSRIVA